MFRDENLQAHLAKLEDILCIVQEDKNKIFSTLYCYCLHSTAKFRSGQALFCCICREFVPPTQPPMSCLAMIVCMWLRDWPEGLYWTIWPTTGQYSEWPLLIVWLANDHDKLFRQTQASQPIQSSDNWCVQAGIQPAHRAVVMMTTDFAIKCVMPEYTAILFCGNCFGSHQNGCSFGGITIWVQRCPIGVFWIEEM